jgi:hypothetical protein
MAEFLARPFLCTSHLLDSKLARFHSETALFRRGGVKLWSCLRGVFMYVCALLPTCFATTKNGSFFR